MGDLTSAAAVFLVSLGGLPIAWLCNFLHSYMTKMVTMSVGFLALALMVIAVHLCRDRTRSLDPLYYVFSICCFSSVVDLLIALENDKIVTGFVDFYLRNGEPYLGTTHGTMICYWDATAHYAMYLTMLAGMAWRVPYRDLGLVWCGSIINSLIVLMIGNFTGKHEITPSTLLNVPFIIVPVYVLVRLLKEPSQRSPPIKSQLVQGDSLLTTSKDILCTILLLVSTTIALVRGCATFSLTDNNVYDLIRKVEPYLLDTVFYSKIQILVYLFYFIPFYMFCLWTLWKSHTNSTMGDWSLVFLGGIAQGQFSYIGAALHPSTPAIYRCIPSSLLFWTLNLLPLATGIVLTWRLAYDTPRKQQTVSRGNANRQNGKSVHQNGTKDDKEGVTTTLRRNPRRHQSQDQ